MHIKNIRLAVAGVFMLALTLLLSTSIALQDIDDAERGPAYMPVPGGKLEDLDAMEMYWNDRLTYPTGRFDPE